MVLITTDISEHVLGFELTFLLIRGFITPVRDFIELNLICYMLRYQEGRRREGEGRAAKPAGGKQFYTEVGIEAEEADWGLDTD